MIDTIDHSIFTILTVLPFLILGTLFLYNWIAPYIISYNLTAKRIEIKLFHLICIRWINLSNVAEIREVGWRDHIGIRGTIGMVFGESWSNRVFVKSFVLIKPKRSFFHRITITPKNPKDFVEQVKSHLSK